MDWDSICSTARARLSLYVAYLDDDGPIPRLECHRVKVERA